MIEDIAVTLLKSIKKDFDSMYRKDTELQSLFSMIKNGKATYQEANDYAIKVGEILAKAYSMNISTEVLPNGVMYYNIANRVIGPTLENNFNLISKAAYQVQESLNKKANIGISTVMADLDKDRIQSIVNKVCSNEYSKVQFMLDEPVVHFSQDIVYDSIKKNAEHQYGAGLKPKIIRREKGSCCDWCKQLAGVYTYPDVPKEVYQRHDHCRCTVEYNPRDGKIQDVHTRKWRDETARDKRIAFSKGNRSIGKDVTAEYFGKASLKQKITYDDTYKIDKHKEEDDVAKLLVKQFGGSIRLLDESYRNGEKRPDYIWNDKYWELKTTSTEKSADSALRKALKQIEGNPGGVILDYRNKNIDSEVLLKIIDARMKRNQISADILLLLGKNIKVYRY